MKFLRSRVTPMLMALAAILTLIAVPILGQTTVNSTTLSAAVTSRTQQVIPLTSVSTVAAGDVLYVDREAMLVQSVNTTAVNATATRGYAGTRADPHASGSAVWTGPPRRFYSSDVFGVCTATAESFLPHIVLPSGNVFQCSNSEWVRYRDNGYRSFNAGRNDGGTTYTAAGALTVQPGLSFINGTTLAMTIVNPTIEQNGLVMIIMATNASAHTVTYTAGFNGGTTARDVATFAAAVGNNLVIVAFNGVWWVQSSLGITLA